MQNRLARFSAWLMELVRFAAVGCINVAVDCAVFTLCLAVLKLPIYQAQLMGITLGLTSCYIFNHIFTFHSDKPFFSFELFKFVILSFICVVGSTIGIDALDSNFELDAWLSKAIVTVVVGIFNYVMCHFFVFKSLRARRSIRWLMKKIYEVSSAIRWNRLAQVCFVTVLSIGVDICMYIYLTYVGLDSYKAQPICVAGGLVCCYLLSIKFLVYKIEHFVGFFCVSIFSLMICSPIMYLFEMRVGLNAFFAKIPATACIAALVYALCRLIVFRDVFDEERLVKQKEQKDE